jgi:hypothetical protein
MSVTSAGDSDALHEGGLMSGEKIDADFEATTNPGHGIFT